MLYCQYDNSRQLQRYLQLFVCLLLSSVTVCVGMSYEEWEFSGLATKQLYRYTGLYCRWENCGKMCCIAWMTMTPIWVLSYRYIWESTQGNHVDPENWDR